MRILVIALEVFGGSKKGGGERYVTESTRALIKLGLSVELVVVKSLSRLYRVEALDGVVVRLTTLEFSRLARSADVIHVHQLNTPGFDYGLVFAKLFKKALVLTDHGGGALTPGRAFGRVRLRFVDGAGFVSAWSKRDLDPSGLIKRTRIIYGGGDHLPPSKPLPKRFTFGFVGRLLPHKGAHIIIEALPEGASLVVAGQQRDSVYFAHLQNLAKGRNVTFLSNAEDDVVSSLHRSVRLFLVPSVERYNSERFARPELLGLVALEALAAGTPVIGSDVGGLGELLKVAGQRVVAPGDVGAWCVAMREAMQEEDAPVEKRAFSWEAVGRKCVDLYNEVLLPTSARG